MTEPPCEVSPTSRFLYAEETSYYSHLNYDCKSFQSYDLCYVLIGKVIELIPFAGNDLVQYCWWDCIINLLYDCNVERNLLLAVRSKVACIPYICKYPLHYDLMILWKIQY